MWRDEELERLCRERTPLIDVRAPGEFADGSVPYSVNLPLIDDHQRHVIGVCYKTQGPPAAMALGHQLVSGELRRQRTQAWVDFIRSQPSAQVFCFRGGDRSRISCEWITAAGIPRQRLAGGYKRLRRFFLSLLEEAPLPPMVRIGGPTGTGKTALLAAIADALDLEGLANHRGSAFGDLGPQPAQATFENHLAAAILGRTSLTVEDESIHIGQRRLPRRFYHGMQAAPLVVVRISREARMENIYRDYVLTKDAAFFLTGAEKIGRRLGGERYGRLTSLIRDAFAAPPEFAAHAQWLRVLLEEYYDPMYEQALERQRALVAFEGEPEAALAYIAQLKASTSI